MAGEAVLAKGTLYVDQIERFVDQSTASGIECMRKEDLQSAWEVLGRAEKVLESLTAQGVRIDPDLVLCVLHNLACCSQRYPSLSLSRLETIASYLDGCVFTIKNRLQIPTGQRLSRWQYECKARIQLCAILSQLNRHESAHQHALEAAKLAERIIQETTRTCREVLAASKRLKKSDSASDFASKVLPTLEGLTARIGIRPLKSLAPARIIDLRTVLGVHPFDHWIYRFNIGDLMRIDTVEVRGLKEGRTLIQEISPDAVYEKIALLVAGYFSLAAEMRFLARKEGKRSEKDRESELWHRKALSISKDFFPAESPLCEHIRLSFERNYTRQVSIPRFHSSLQRRKKAYKPLMKTFDSTNNRVGFCSPKGGTAEAIVAEIVGKVGRKPRCSSAGRPTSANIRNKRPQADSSPVIIVSSIPTEESEENSMVTDKDLILLQQKRRAKKVNVSILDDEESSTVKAASPLSGSEEEIVLTSSVLYGEKVDQGTRAASLGDFHRKKAVR